MHFSIVIYTVCKSLAKMNAVLPDLKIHEYLAGSRP